MNNPKPRIPSNRVMTTTTVAALILLAVLVGARATGILPTANELSPAGAIALCAAFTALVGGGSVWYLARTDEHDLNANLWAMAWGWLASSLVTLNWAVLHIAGLVPVPDSIAILMVGTVVVLVIWLWLRFR